jgi:hypothetical protein
MCLKLIVLGIFPLAYQHIVSVIVLTLFMSLVITTKYLLIRMDKVHTEHCHKQNAQWQNFHVLAENTYEESKKIKSVVDYIYDSVWFI